MRKLLLLAYFFPPIGGAGSQRNTKLVRYLSEFGWDPVVITGPGSPDYYWTPIDRSLLDEIPSDVAIHRTSGTEPPFSTGWRDRTERWLLTRSPWERWWRQECLEIAQGVAADVDLVYASIAPYATARTAVVVAQALDKPLVVDLEDPWAFDEMAVYPSLLHRRLELRRMRRTLEAASGVVMNTSEAAARVRRSFSGLPAESVTAIPNGYDAADFSGPAPATDGKLRIVHTGSLHTEFALRHRSRRRVHALLRSTVSSADPLTRSHVYLVRAIQELRDEGWKSADQIELHLAGRLTDADLSVIANADFVTTHGFLSHRETVGLMRSAALLFLPMHDVAEGQRVSIVPCKTYEYLASERPILAAVPDGDARDLLTEAGNAYLCRPSDVAAMKRAIKDELARRDGGAGAPMPSRILLESLERRHLTAALSRFLEDVENPWHEF